MLEKIRNWLQDWSDACEYANECAPDLTFLTPYAPKAWLVAAGILALSFWAADIWRLKRLGQHGRAHSHNGHAHDLTLQVHLSPSAFADVATTAFITLISALAQFPGFQLTLFPELGALANDVFRKPQGVWANAPFMLMATPFIAGLAGTLITNMLPYGMASIMISVGAAILVIRFLKSPIAPAISAGLLPVTLGETSWWYPPSLLVGTGLLAGVSYLRRQFLPQQLDPTAKTNLKNDPHTSPLHVNSWVIFFSTFLLVGALSATFTGIRFLLFPPLVVIAFEMYAHALVCPWAYRPLILPAVCGLTAGAGVLLVVSLGAGPEAAALSVICGAVVLRAVHMHIPPAIAVGLLPFIMKNPDQDYVIAVIFGTALLSLSFLLWRIMTPMDKNK